MEYNSDFSYDLKVGLMSEIIIGQLLTNRTVEVKMDFGVHKTGNFYIEYKSRNKPSGIAKTEADYWILIAASEEGLRHRYENVEVKEEDILYFITIPTERLKVLCRTKYKRKDVPGGDENTSLGVLIQAIDLL
jgi:hypothetical protein|tara:strand:+ start:3419 stop:3817 length:399 start_codon:yes stop_codon:yes gene_type:complete